LFPPRPSISPWQQFEQWRRWTDGATRKAELLQCPAQLIEGDRREASVGIVIRRESLDVCGKVTDRPPTMRAVVTKIDSERALYGLEQVPRIFA
jgi:hypothetical protein